MKRLYISLILLTVTGCMTSDGLSTLDMSETNVSNISRVRMGMTEHEVHHIMHKAYKYSELDQDGYHYDTWFYVTSPTIMAQTQMVHNNLTPITFRKPSNSTEDGTVAGIGWDYYRALINHEKIGSQPTLRTPPETPQTPEQQQQAKEIEDALKAQPTQTDVTPEQSTQDESTEVIVSPSTETSDTPTDEVVPKKDEEGNIEKVLNTEPAPKQPVPTQPTPTQPTPVKSTVTVNDSLADASDTSDTSEEEEGTGKGKSKDEDSCPVDKKATDKESDEMLRIEQDQGFNFW
jgi:hypothetical protein